jgi:pyruvate formate lyase activating enzyme
MRIGGLAKTTLIDFPGKIAAIVFTQGCNFRCGFCHNPELVDPAKFCQPLVEDDIFEFLIARQGKLQGVVITGGEPTLHRDLPEFIRKIKALGYAVKLDSNGTNPSMVELLIKDGLVDYIAMDIKAPWHKYHEVTSSVIDVAAVQTTAQLLMSSPGLYEFRTTIVREQLSFEDLIEIGNQIAGARLYVLQQFVPSKCYDPTFVGKTSYSREELMDLQHQLANVVCSCFVR